MSLGERKMAMRYRLKPKNLTQNYLLDTKRTLDQEPFQQASLLDNTSLGAYYDFIDAGGQLNYEDFLQYQSIPQSDRPLTGQTPTEQLFGIQRQLFGGGTLPKNVQKFLIETFPELNLKFGKGFPKYGLLTNNKNYNKVLQAANNKIKNPNYVFNPDFESLKYDKNFGTAKQLLEKAKSKGIYVNEKTRTDIFAKNFNIKSKRNPYSSNNPPHLIYDLSSLDNPKKVEQIIKAQIKSGFYTPETGEKYLSQEEQARKKRETYTKRSKAIKKYSVPSVEKSYQGTKNVNLSHMDDIFNQYTTGYTLGYAPGKINKEFLTTYDNKIKALYEKRKRLNKQQPKGYLKELEKINEKGARLAGETGGYKSFLFEDPYSKKTYQFGIDYSKTLDPTGILKGKRLQDVVIQGNPLDPNSKLVLNLNPEEAFIFEKNRKEVLKSQSKINPTKKIEELKTSNKKQDKLRKSIADSLRKAGFKCKFAGSVGGSVGCDDPMSYLDDIKRSQNMVASGSPEGKARALTKFRRAKTFLTGTLGPYALAGEALFSVPFALYDYATGADKNEIISNLTLGLGGKSQEEQLKEIYGDDFGLAQKAVETDARLQALDRLQEGTRGQRIRSKGKFDIAEKQFEEQISPFMIDGQLDQAAFEKNLIQEELGRKEFLKEKAKRAEEIKDTLTGLEIPGIDLTRETYQDAGFVDKLEKGAKAFDPRNLPYYGQRALKGLMAGTEMAVKFPVAAGAAISETLRQKPSMGTLRRFGEAMQPTATEYLSEKTGLENLIKKAEARIAEQDSGAKTVGDILQLGSELIPPATGYIKLLEDSGSKLYKVIRDGRAGKQIKPEDFEQVAEILSEKGVSRRDFMKVVGGSSVYGLAKYIGLADAVKIAEKVKPVRMLAKTSTKMPAWFPNFASKILDDTDTVFKQIDEDIVEITNKNLPDLEINKYADGRWEISGTNEYGQRYAIDYEPPTILEDGTSYPGDFTVMDSVPVRSGPDDVDFDAELVETIDDVLGGTSKLEEWTKGVKRKDLTRGEKRVIEAEGRAEADYDAWRESEDFVDE